jgi:hypothetical protein
MIQLSAMNTNNATMAKINNGIPKQGMLRASRNRIVATIATTIQKMNVSICTALLQPAPGIKVAANG